MIDKALFDMFHEAAPLRVRACIFCRFGNTEPARGDTLQDLHCFYPVVNQFEDAIADLDDRIGTMRQLQSCFGHSSPQIQPLGCCASFVPRPREWRLGYVLRRPGAE